MTAVFFYGTLCHVPLLEQVLGRRPALAPAQLPDHEVLWAAGESFPLIRPAPGAIAEGLLAPDLTPADLARLDFYEGGFAFAERAVTVATGGGGAVTARLFWPEAGLWQPGAPWSLAEWEARWAETVVAAAGDFMALYGRAAPGAVRARYQQMLVRAGARVRARQTMPTALRHRAGPGDIALAELRQPYANFFAVEEADIAWRRFDGTMTPPVTRAAFVSGDAVVVLPYDPRRDRVLIVEQFRMGPYARGDAQPWLLEPVAGRIDGGESPEEAALRESVEEARLEVSRLIAGPSCYASPGAKTEYLYSFVALADLPDEAAGIAGMEAETEDIRSHVLPFERLMALIDSGEADNAPLILLALWLDRRRAALRAEVAA